MNYFRRDIEDELVAFLDADNGEHVVLLSGARQTGKSTIVENFGYGKKKVIINLWDEERAVSALKNAPTFSEFEHVLSTVFQFTPNGEDLLIIDEAQASPFLSSFIMEMHRKWRGQKVILLGSLLANLYKKGQPMPVGRTVEFICRPLNFREFLRFGNKEHLYQLITAEKPLSLDLHTLLLDEYCRFLQLGGLPGVVNAYYSQQNTVILFESLLNNIYRDADRFIEPLTTTRQNRVPQYGRILEAVLSSAAHHIGSPTQNATLLSTDSPAYRTVLPHVLEALDVWHLMYTLTLQTKQFSTKKGYSSKKYLFDTGIANFLLTRSLPVRWGDGDQVAAMLLENGVLQDCMSSVESSNAVSCYRSNNRVSTELDFVVTKGQKSFPLEVKSTRNVKQNTLSQLVSYLDESGGVEGYVLYTGMPEKREVGGKCIQLLPSYAVLDLLERGHVGNALHQ